MLHTETYQQDGGILRRILVRPYVAVSVHPATTLTFILFFPLLMEYVYSDFVRESEFNTRVGWFLVLLATYRVIKNKSFRILTLGLFTLSGSLDNLYATTFGGVFTTASFEALALTDPHEAFEFIQVYSGFTNLGLLGLYLTGSVYLARRMRLPEKNTYWTRLAMSLGAVFVVVAAYRILIMHSYYDTIPGSLGIVPSYLADIKSVAQLTAERKKLAGENHVTIALDHPNTPQTYVFIIGESLTRRHMGLYGYPRNTTPELSAMRSELAVFRNVVSAFAQTQPSLCEALTQASTNKRLAVDDALSIMDMANKAGFKTWWISNQQPLRGSISAIAAMADITQFISNDYQGVEVKRYDGFLLSYIAEALQNNAPKKAIFVHFMGSHLQYANRYPAEFARFTDHDVHGYRPDLSTKQIRYINGYDDTVYYTDFVVTSIIKNLKEATAQTHTLSAALFFSDHGEEIFDTMNLVGHRPDQVTAGMVEIPFIVWLSKQYQQQRPAQFVTIQNNLDKPYMLDDAIYTMMDLMGMKTTLLDRSRSLISADYRPKPRIIYGWDYDHAS